ncbi:MAG: hypothetical protein EOP48_21265, partial [Sphingobacteriales bacterium]
MDEEIFQDLIEIHKSIFIHAITTARGNTTIPLFSIQAPGHIGIDSIEVPNLNLEYHSLPKECQNNIRKVFSTGSFCKQFPLERDGVKNGIIDHFLHGVRRIYLLSVVANPLNRYESYLFEASRHSRSITEWIEKGTQFTSINIIIQPKVDLGRITSIGKWHIRNLTIPELCIEGHLGFQSPQEACERVFASSFFTRDMDTMPQSPAEILAEDFAHDFRLPTTSTYDGKTDPLPHIQHYQMR